MSRDGEKQAPAGPVRRSQAERREATRSALLETARRLFAEFGYAEVGTEEIVREAGVTRGALYHHFAGKRDLFAAVFEQIEAELVERLAGSIDPAEDPIEVMQSSIDGFLTISLEAEVQKIALLDAPSVLGWEAWHEIERRHGLGVIEALLGAAIEQGRMRPLPLAPLAHALLGALIEGALYVSRSDDVERARTETSRGLRALVEGLR